MPLQITEDAVLAELHTALETQTGEPLYQCLWDTLSFFQGRSFRTYRGLEFTYSIRGYEMFVDRKEKSITRATVELTLDRAIQRKGHVTGPKKLGTFGASYLYPIFQALGIL